MFQNIFLKIFSYQNLIIKTSFKIENSKLKIYE